MTPRILQADAYTIGSGLHCSPDAKDYSAYQVVFRNTPPWLKELGGEPRMIFHGLQHIMQQLFAELVSTREVDESARFLKTFHAGGKPFKWDSKVWKDSEYTTIPIRIWALRDGAVCFPGEPVIQVEAMDGFGELAGYFESKLLQVWATSEMASLMRHRLDYNKDLVRKCNPTYLTEAQLNFLAGLMIHDFGDRASSCAEESEVLGLAFLTSHFSTDTVAAAYRAWVESCEEPTGSSIKALAHRIVQGFEKEEDAYLSLYSAEPGTFTSHVADCYDFYNAVDQFLVPLAKKAKETGGVIVARPDSGEPYEQMLYVLEAAKDAGLYEKTKEGLIKMTHLRVIQGNEMNFHTMTDIDERMMRQGYSPIDCYCYGLGSYKRNILSRDNLAATMKLCAVGKDRRPVMKFSHTPTKASIPGLAKVCRDGGPTVRGIHEAGDNEMVLWYDGIGGDGIVYEEPFNKVRERVLYEFHKYPVPSEIFSQHIKNLKKELHAKYVHHRV